MCEPLARLGATVTGIDASEANIEIANAHARRDPRLPHIEYKSILAENLLKEINTSKEPLFDVVCSLEVIEHVPHNARADFVKTLSALVKPGGAVFLSTINRTPKAFGLV